MSAVFFIQKLLLRVISLLFITLIHMGQTLVLSLGSVTAPFTFTGTYWIMSAVSNIVFNWFFRRRAHCRAVHLHICSLSNDSNCRLALPDSWQMVVLILLTSRINIYETCILFIVCSIQLGSCWRTLSKSIWFVNLSLLGKWLFRLPFRYIILNGFQHLSSLSICAPCLENIMCPAGLLQLKRKTILGSRAQLCRTAAIVI